MNEKILDTEIDILISTDLKKFSESLRKGETLIDLKFFYEGGGLRNARLEKDSNMEKFTDYLRTPEYDLIYLQTGNTSFSKLK